MAGHTHDLRAFSHSHAFADGSVHRREQALTRVTLITLVAMLVELAAGWWTGSLALLADGWHMGTHALALGGAALAYRLSARAASRSGYAFGGWKIEVLAAYTSGLALLVAALWIAVDAVARLRQPEMIAYRQAIGVAVFGLVVNVVCAWLLSRGANPERGHGHGHGDGHGHGQGQGQGNGHGNRHDHHDGPGHGHGEHEAHGQPARQTQPSHPGHHGHPHDHNFSAAYMHVLADAFTSVLAIAALTGGLFFGWGWLDPAVALLGAVVIGQWSIGVLRHSAKALVDATADPAVSLRIRDLVEADGDAKIADLHVWQVGANAWTAALSIVADQPLPAAAYRERLRVIEQLRHVTVEVHRCPDASPA